MQIILFNLIAFVVSVQGNSSYCFVDSNMNVGDADTDQEMSTTDEVTSSARHHDPHHQGYSYAAPDTPFLHASEPQKMSYDMF